MATTPQIEDKRQVLGRATSRVIDRLWEFELARDTLKQERRRLKESELSDLVAEVEEKEAAYATARANEATRSQELFDLVSAFLPFPAEGGLTDEQAFDSELSALESVAPIVLFPLRLETRFEGTVLKVRVYPDEIFLDSHEVALTPVE